MMLDHPFIAPHNRLVHFNTLIVIVVIRSHDMVRLIMILLIIMSIVMPAPHKRLVHFNTLVIVVMIMMIMVIIMMILMSIMLLDHQNNILNDEVNVEDIA